MSLFYGSYLDGFFKMNLIGKFSQRQKFIVLIGTVIILPILTWFGYWLYQNKIKAATPYANCPIKVVDGNIGIKGIKALVPLFGASESGSAGYTLTSDSQGCFIVPRELRNRLKAGDYLQATLADSLPDRAGKDTAYKFDNISHLPLTKEVLGGAKQIILKPKYSLNTADTTPQTQTTTATTPAGKAMLIFKVYNALSSIRPDDGREASNYGREPIQGAKIVVTGSDAQTPIGNCTTDAGGTCGVDYIFHDETPAEVKVTVIKEGGLPAFESPVTNTLSISSGGSSLSVLTSEIYMWPLSTSVATKTLTGTSSNKYCQNKTRQFEAQYFASSPEEQPKWWSGNALQGTVDWLATIICALETDKPGIYAPTPKLLFFSNNLSNTPSAYVSSGQANIAIDSSFTQLSTDETLRKYILAHEYGHVIDEGGIGLQLTNNGGRYSGTVNWNNLFPLFGTKEKPSTDIIISPDSSKYFLKNTAEFWAESFSRHMWDSLDAVTLSSRYNSLNFTLGEEIPDNVYDFIKKYLSTALSTFCGVLDDDNYIHAPELITLMSNPRPNTGGPLGKDYTSEEIKTGVFKKVNNESHNIPVKISKLPAGYVSQNAEIIIVPSTDREISIPVGDITNPPELDPLKTRTWCGYANDYIKMDDKPGSQLYTNDVTRRILLGEMEKFDLKAIVKNPQCGKNEVKTIAGPFTLNTTKSFSLQTIDFAKLTACEPTTSLTVNPTSLTLQVGTNGTLINVSGGKTPYALTIQNPSYVSVTKSSETKKETKYRVKALSPGVGKSTMIIVRDSSSPRGERTVNVNITQAGALSFSPSPVTVEKDRSISGKISGGEAPFSVSQCGKKNCKTELSKNTGNIVYVTGNKLGSDSFSISDSSKPKQSISVPVTITDTTGGGDDGGGGENDTQKPLVSIWGVSQLQKVGKTVSITVAATDNAKVSKVWLKIGGKQVAVADKSSIIYSWDTTKYPNGGIMITGGAQDSSGNMGGMSVSVYVNNSTSKYQSKSVGSIVAKLANGLKYGQYRYNLLNFYYKTRYPKY
ncbi:MAG TPA: Ig-like domain-containing protein [Patescibacteria group bacterium]|nr:Ig-like domain-containing protein [Patescibacteria group bacterium]